MTYSYVHMKINEDAFPDKSSIFNDNFPFFIDKVQ